MKIAVWNQKGGPGKTTAVVSLARVWHAQHPTIWDTDEQVATSNFKKSLKGCSIVPINPSSIDARTVMPDGLLLMDCWQSFAGSRPALELADLILMPLEPCVANLKATLQAVGAIDRNLPGKEYRIFLVRYTSKVEDHPEIRAEAREHFGSRLLKTSIGFHRSIELAYNRGLTVMDYAPGSTPARQYERLAEEVMSVCQGF